jgi:protein-S-isoprenylcysteine O-methyltransferase Ste14
MRVLVCVLSARLSSNVINRLRARAQRRDKHNGSKSNPLSLLQGILSCAVVLLFFLSIGFSRSSPWEQIFIVLFKFIGLSLIGLWIGEFLADRFSLNHR